MCMIIASMTEKYRRSERDELFQKAERELQYAAQIYRIGERFEGLEPELSKITMLDVTQIPGCHYGAKNVFVPMIRELEDRRIASIDSRIVVSPDTAILVEPSTGNGWVAFSDAAEMLGYEHMVVMPDGLPDARYNHPLGREVEMIRTPKEEYVEGLPRKLNELMNQNRQRIREGKKIFVTPNHAAGRAHITAEKMSDLGRRLLENIGDSRDPITLIVSMGNGASVCGVGGYVKKNIHESKLVVTESFAYGGGYDWYAKRNGLSSYRELFGIDLGDSRLMAKFSAYGTNAPIGMEMPLQTRAIEGDLIDEYVLFTDNEVLQAFKDLKSNDDHLKNALELSNYSLLPQALAETYGNSTLANIAESKRFGNKGERVVALAYDSRKNY